MYAVTRQTDPFNSDQGEFVIRCTTFSEANLIATYLEDHFYGHEFCARKYNEVEKFPLADDAFTSQALQITERFTDPDAIREAIFMIDMIDCWSNMDRAKSSALYSRLREPVPELQEIAA